MNTKRRNRCTLKWVACCCHVGNKWEMHPGIGTQCLESISDGAKSNSQGSIFLFSLWSVMNWWNCLQQHAPICLHHQQTLHAGCNLSSIACVSTACFKVTVVPLAYPIVTWNFLSSSMNKLEITGEPSQDVRISFSCCPLRGLSHFHCSSNRKQTQAVHYRQW